MTPAQKRDIFYRAAAYIEAHPGEYRFTEVRVPMRGECGCMWGHVGRIAGVPAGKRISVATEAFGFYHNDLYNHADGLEFGIYTEEAQSAARLMRAFADHHWPAPEKPIAMRFPELMRLLGAEVDA